MPRLPAIVAFSALLAGGGCIENTLGGKPGDTAPPDTDTAPGDTAETADSAETADTSETADSAPPTCPDQAWEAQPVEPLAECPEPPATGPWSIVPEWHLDAFTKGDAGSIDCMMAPIVCSLTDDNGDGRTDENDDPDVVFVTYAWSGNGTVRALNGADGAELWASAEVVEPQGGLACGDLDNDGLVEVIGVALGPSVVVLEGATGSVRWTSAGVPYAASGIADAPGIADLDADGSPEVVLGRMIVDSAGAVVGEGAAGLGINGSLWIGPASVVADLDLDGQQELQAGNTGYARDGTTVWSNAEADGFPAPGNFDADPEGELAVTSSGGMRIQDTDGTVLCKATLPGGDRYYGGGGVVADFDGDGEAEVGIASRSSYTVFDADCSILWEHAGTSDYTSGMTAAAVFDFEGDGVPEVVYADELHLWIFAGRDGATLAMLDHYSNTWVEYATVADVDGDDHAEIVTCEAGGGHGVTVYGEETGAWVAARRLWNQHAYTIEGVNDDGSIPASPTPSWLGTGTFRAAELGQPPTAVAADLRPVILDVCLDECAEGRATLWYAVENIGLEDVTDAVTVEVLASVPADTGAVETLVSTATWESGLATGIRSASVQVDLEGVAAWTSVRVVVDGGAARSAIAECDETNNEAEWADVLCP